MGFYMRVRWILIFIFCSSVLFSQVPEEELPFLALTSMSLHSGVAVPLEPSAFPTYWHAGPLINVGMDFITRNNLLFNLSIGFNYFKFDDVQFKLDKGVADLANSYDFNANITNIIISYKTASMLSEFNEIHVEAGGGYYFIERVDTDNTYLNRYDETELVYLQKSGPGISVAVSLRRWFSDTFSTVLKARFNHVFNIRESHQTVEILLGATIH